MIRRSFAAIDTASAASPRSCASMKLASSARSASLGSPADQSVRLAGRCACSVARARWSALLTDATEVSSADRRLARRPAEHVPGDQRRALARREDLERGEERELDRLAGDDDRLGLLVARRDLVEQAVRVGRDPGHLARTSPSRSAGGRCAGSHRGRRWSRSVQPGADERAAVERLARPPRPQERLLDGVLGLVERGEHPVAVDVELAPVSLGEGRERGLPTGECGRGLDRSRSDLVDS